MNTTWPCAARANVSLGQLTTLKVGGSVEWLLEPANPEELVQAFGAAREAGHEPRILGGGANLIIPDGSLAGVVISTARMARTFRPMETGEEPTPEAMDLEPGGDRSIVAEGKRIGASLSGEITAPAIDRGNPRLVVWAGSSMPGLVRAASELGWSGLEGLIGVPGSLGGCIAMNAGGRWGELFDVVELIRVINNAGELVDVTREETKPSYRNGGLAEIEAAVVVGAVLKLQLAKKGEVKARARQYLIEKRAAQPVTEASAGCIFKNPTELYRDEKIGAGKLIDVLGLKQLGRGKARVSQLHGNFIINDGGATATDVLGLIADLQSRVFDRSGIKLQVEVRRW